MPHIPASHRLLAGAARAGHPIRRAPRACRATIPATRHTPSFAVGMTKKCAQATFAKAGGACGLVAGEVVVCEGGGSNLSISCSGFAPPLSVMGTCPLRRPTAQHATR